MDWTFINDLVISNIIALQTVAATLQKLFWTGYERERKVFLSFLFLFWLIY
jgi:hypothetical protein